MTNISALSFSWLDVVDILLVTMLIYYVILFVRGTRAIAALNGLFLLLAAYILAQMIGLYSLVWLLDNLFGSLFIVIVVLFHEDIRQALSSLSVASLFNKKQNLSDDVIKIISDTCFSLAKTHTGAIIVIEMKMPLGDMMEKGVKIDGHLSQDLLSTLFFPKTPLHDGAVILDSKGKIMAAGCILPLAGVQRQHFGTRHRAAIGITEVSDAVAVVVSEERGEVTIAREGNLSNPLTPERFERMLKHVIS